MIIMILIQIKPKFYHSKIVKITRTFTFTTNVIKIDYKIINTKISTIEKQTKRNVR